jgi:hypothetical protein
MSYNALAQALQLDIEDKTKIDYKYNDTNTEENNLEEPFTNNNADKLFSVTDFIESVRQKGASRNESVSLKSESISAYDVAHNCIRTPIFRITNQPVKTWQHTWLPIGFRASMGNAGHDFIQDHDDNITESECTLKVPSRRLSSRLDSLIGDNVLIEIKTCSYTDYNKIISSQKPRPHDYLQSLLYKYLLENHLDELKKQKPTHGGTIPKLEKYNIEYIQLVYVCHELVSADSASLSESVKFATNLKKSLESRRNPFWFITCNTIDLKKQEADVNEKISLINEKIDLINEHLDKGTVPDINNKFVDKKACFFCLYKDVCKKIP